MKLRASAGTATGLSVALHFLVLFATLAGRLFGAELANPATAFDDAARLYEQGKFGEAAASYQRLITNGVVTSAVLHNQGNAWLKAGQTGRAIASFLQAQQLAPRDAEIRSNLRFARSKVVGAPPAPGGPAQLFLLSFKLNEWAWAATIALWLWFAVLIARECSTKWRDRTTGLTWFLGVTAVALAIGALAAAWQWSQSGGVIIAETSVRFGPLEESQSAFAVPDGTEVRLTDRKGDWLEIRDGAGRKGWILAGQVVEPR